MQVLSHVCDRVKTLHDLGVVHRDLKPGNILWRPGQHSWTLIDFGCAAEIGATHVAGLEGLCR
jgi:eukaryotic-like serine/threonine-protein kinase